MVAAQRLPQAARASWLRELQQRDAALHDAVVSFLAFDASTQPHLVVGTPTDEPSAAPLAGTRFEDRGLLGLGGMGEVRQAWDPRLRRTVAIKFLRTRHHIAPPEHRQDLVARFVHEAQLQAQLSHPGVVAVHERGELPDGRPYLVMPEVRGHTLQLAIRDHIEPNPAGLRRLAGAFAAVCETTAYAHSRSVIHRDLKPDNVMLGPFGETLVLDWGLGTLLNDVHEAFDAPLAPISTERGGTLATQPGLVVGTPAFMAPEQARGEILDDRADVYALGGILLRILTREDPFEGRESFEILAMVRTGSAPRLPDGARPKALAELCRTALALKPMHRPSARELATEVRAWLDGIRARARGRALVAEAKAMRAEATAWRSRADSLEADAAQQLEAGQRWDPIDVKAPAWARQEEAADLRRRAQVADAEARATAASALHHDASLPEAHAWLADHFHDQHRQAEANRDWAAAEPLAALIRRHDQPGRHAAYLRGRGALTLVTEPPGPTSSCSATRSGVDDWSRWRRSPWVQRPFTDPDGDGAVPVRPP